MGLGDSCSIARCTQRGGGGVAPRTKRRRWGGTRDGEHDEEHGKSNKKATYINPTTPRSVFQFLRGARLDKKYSYYKDTPEYDIPVDNAHTLIEFPHTVPTLTESTGLDEKKTFFMRQMKYYTALQKSLTPDERIDTDTHFVIQLDAIRKHCKLPPVKKLRDTAASIGKELLWKDSDDKKLIEKWWEMYTDENSYDANIEVKTHAEYPIGYKNLVKLDTHIEKLVAEGKEDNGLSAFQLDLLGKRVKEMIKLLQTKYPDQAKTKALNMTQKHIKVQVLEADRRQLLMLLCGNVPATLFVDKRTGYIRRPKQICHHILFLLKSHRMSNSGIGRYTKVWTSGLHAVYIGAGYILMLVQWTLLLCACSGMLMGIVYVFHGSSLNTLLRRRVVYGMFQIFLFMWDILMKLLDMVLGTGRPEWTYNVHPLRGNPTRETDALLQLVTSVGFMHVIYRLLNNWKVDIDKVRRVTALRFLVTKITDQWTLLTVSHYIAQAQTGLFGEDSASGLTDEQMGLMYKVQQALKELDEEIDLHSERTVDRSNYLDLLEEYGNTYKSGLRQRLCIDLHNTFQNAHTHPLNPRHFRAKMLQKYEHEFRAHHFFNSYGEPRSALNIVLAYLLCWRREEKMNTVLPTVPYKGRELVEDYLNPMNIWEHQEKRDHILKGEWWQINPIQCSEWARLHSSDPLVAGERSVDNNTDTEKYINGVALLPDYQEERHTKNTKDFRQHLDLDYLFKNEKGYEGWIQAKLGSNEVAINKFRAISGWTHRVSDAFLARVNQQFEVMNANDVTDYKRWNDRQLMGRARASVKANKHYHQEMHESSLAERGLFSAKDAGLDGSSARMEYTTLATKLKEKILGGMLPTGTLALCTKLQAVQLFVHRNDPGEYEAYEKLRKCIYVTPDDDEAARRLLYWCGFYAMSAEYKDDDLNDNDDSKDVKRQDNPFRNHPDDEYDYRAKLSKGYSKVLKNRLGKRGVEHLRAFFLDYHFVRFIIDNRTNHYLGKCLTNMLSNT